jgi:hypothetical protein
VLILNYKHVRTAGFRVYKLYPASYLSYAAPTLSYAGPYMSFAASYLIYAAPKLFYFVGINSTSHPPASWDRHSQYTCHIWLKKDIKERRKSV